MIRSSRKRRLYEYMRNDDGAALVEYSLLVSLIAVATFGAVALFGTQLSGMYRWILAQISAA